MDQHLCYLPMNWWQRLKKGHQLWIICVGLFMNHVFEDDPNESFGSLTKRVSSIKTCKGPTTCVSFLIAWHACMSCWISLFFLSADLLFYHTIKEKKNRDFMQWRRLVSSWYDKSWDSRPGWPITVVGIIQSTWLDNSEGLNSELLFVDTWLKFPVRSLSVERQIKEEGLQVGLKSLSFSLDYFYCENDFYAKRRKRH